MVRRHSTEDMRLAGYSARTQEAFVHAVARVVAHVGKQPPQISEEDRRRHSPYLTQEKRVARRTATIALCAARFFFEKTLRKEWTTLELVRPAPAGGGNPTDVEDVLVERDIRLADRVLPPLRYNSSRRRA